MKIELTVKVTYLPEWGEWEGVRELIQNARDEEVRSEKPMRVSHNGRFLRIFNEGSRLKHKDLLFGQTDKEDRTDLAGQFGEGLKLGTLALIRSGHDVTIRTGDEIWTPSIEHSVKFDEKVLVFTVRKGKDIGGTQINVSGIEPLRWAKWRERFLFLAPLEPGDLVEVPGYGSILIAPMLRSKLFVKGIFVQNGDDLLYGYDFDDIEVDRDRKMIPSFDLKWKTSAMWRLAVSSAEGKALLPKYYAALVENSNDVSNLGDRTAAYLPDEVVEDLKARFERDHGMLAVPVTDLSQSKEVAHMGFKGVIVGQALMNALLAKSGGLDALRKQAARNVVRIHSWHDLTPKEQKIFETAFEHLALAGVEIRMSDVEIVDFSDERRMGMFKNGKISVARKRLSDVSSALETLIHEHAHHHGDDGSHEHIRVIERTWAAVHRSTWRG